MMLFDQNNLITTRSSRSYTAKQFDIFWVNRAILARKALER